MIHLGTCNISYGQKKGQKSKCQFDSWPLKVRNHPKLPMCKWRATYHWKYLNEGYNFTLNLTSMEGLHKILWASKVVGVLISGISGLSTWETWVKWHFGATPMANYREHYKREGGGLP
jgi:hypothetical protein